MYSASSLREQGESELNKEGYKEVARKLTERFGFRRVK